MLSYESEGLSAALLGMLLCHCYPMIYAGRRREATRSNNANYVIKNPRMRPTLENVGRFRIFDKVVLFLAFQKNELMTLTSSRMQNAIKYGHDIPFQRIVHYLPFLLIVAERPCKELSRSCSAFPFLDIRLYVHCILAHTVNCSCSH